MVYGLCRIDVIFGAQENLSFLFDRKVGVRNIRATQSNIPSAESGDRQRAVFDAEELPTPRADMSKNLTEYFTNSGFPRNSPETGAQIAFAHVPASQFNSGAIDSAPIPSITVKVIGSLHLSSWISRDMAHPPQPELWPRRR